jgi:Tfp pilus assembly protein PilO
LDEHDVKIWNRGKARFLETIAYSWIISNRLFEIFLVVGIVIFFLGGWLRYIGGEKRTIEEVEQHEQEMDEKEKQNRIKTIEEGFKKNLGLILTWRKK